MKSLKTEKLFQLNLSFFCSSKNSAVKATVWRHDIQHNDIQLNGTQDNNEQT